MLRRHFLRYATAAAAIGAASCKTPMAVAAVTTDAQQTKPVKLERGDKVMLICPGGPISQERLQKAIDNLTKLGYTVTQGDHLLAKYGFVAGTDEERLADLHAAFQDPSVKAVWPVRGGYGCTRLLPKIDFELIRANPKLLIGYSDITALLMAFYQKLGLVGIHGPLGSSTFSPFNERNLMPLITQEKAGHSIYLPPAGIKMVKGKAKGVLVGGNLSLLAAMAGTPWSMDA
ncbi:MAG: LD-carboxypeptidase, partial [Bacteroidota bacterium]